MENSKTQVLEATTSVISLLNAGKYREAIAVGERAVQFAEQNPAIKQDRIYHYFLGNLGMAYYQIGDYSRAESIFRPLLAIYSRQPADDPEFYITLLSNMGQINFATFQYDAAEEMMVEVLKIDEQFLAPNHPDLIIDLNNLAMLVKQKIEYHKAETYLLRAIEIANVALKENDRKRGIAYDNLGDIYEAWGRYDEAESAYQQAITIFKQANGAYNADLAVAIARLADLYRLKGEFHKAAILYQQNLEILERVYGSEHPRTINATVSLAKNFYSLGDHRQYQHFFDQAVNFATKQENRYPAEIVNTWSELAGIYHNRGNFKAAEDLYKKTISIQMSLYSRSGISVASSFVSLAGLYKEIGQYSQADALYNDALAIYQTRLGKNSPSFASTLSEYAVLHYIKGDYQRADAQCQQALAILKKIYGDESPVLIPILNTLASIKMDEGLYDDSEIYSQQSLALRRQLLTPDHYLIAQSLNNIAEIYRLQGKLAAATPYYEEALQMFKKKFGPNHPQVGTVENNLGLTYLAMQEYDKSESAFQRAIAIHEAVYGTNHLLTAKNYVNLGMLYYAKQQPEASLSCFEKGFHIHHAFIPIILAGGSEDQKSAFIYNISGDLDISVSFHLIDHPKMEQAGRLAFEVMLQRKGRILDALASGIQHLRQFGDDDPGALIREYNRVNSEASQLILNGLKGMTPDAYHQRLKELGSRSIEIQREISRKTGSSYMQTPTVTLQFIQDALPPQSALIEYVRYRRVDPRAKTLGETFCESYYGVYVFDYEGNLSWVNLGKAVDIDKRVTDFRLNLKNPKDIYQVQGAARGLDKALLEPVRHQLKNINTLFIAADSELNLIPFAALFDERQRYLIQDYTLIYLTTGRDLLQTHAKRQPRIPLLIGNPDYDAAFSIRTTPAADTMVETAVGLQGIRFSPLQGTEEEIHAIADIITPSKVLNGADATETALKQARAPEILHVATHGFFLTQDLQEPPVIASRNVSFISDDALPLRSGHQSNPMIRSGIALAGANQGSQSTTEDGILTALELSGLDLVGTKLVVLSACETGVGRTSTGDGIHGLRRALLIAGSQTQVMSLWKVADKETKDLMTAFYQGLKAGVGRAEALRQAQLEMSSHSVTAHPYFWASFILSGDWRPVAFSTGKE